MNARIWAVVRTRFAGIHSYPNAPQEVEFLRHPHRHMFHVEVHVEQIHAERDIEYITLKRWLDSFIEHHHGDRSTWSCEQIAEAILNAVRNRHADRSVKVGVSEDGENGALLEWDA